MVVQVIHLLPSVTVTDPNATTLGTGTASIGDGVISRWTYAAGSGTNKKTQQQP